MANNTAVKKECFVVSPIGAAGSDTRRRSNQVFRHVVSATLEPMGYTLTRGDNIEETGQITSQVIDKILNASLVVADLTDLNANVFYELAVRHAIGKPFIQLMAEGQKLPFDIQSLRTIFFTYTDLDSVHEAKLALASMARTLEEGGRVETPMTFTLDLQSLRQSEDSEARGIADIIQELSVVKKMVSDVRRPVRTSNADVAALRNFVEFLRDRGRLDAADQGVLITQNSSDVHDSWVSDVFKNIDPWGSVPPGSASDDEPPF